MGSGIKYSPEFRARAVKQVVEYSRPNRTVAGELGIKADTLRTWTSRAKREGFEMAEAEETDLEVEVRRLRKEFLKRRRASSQRSRTQSVVRSDRYGEAGLSDRSHVLLGWCI